MTDITQLSSIIKDSSRLIFSDYVESFGLFYPPDPGEKRASIGGNISTNAGGMRAVKYGVTRDYVMGLEIVKADGTVITLGSKNRKDTTGLDLKDILIGSEGTLAVITKCLLRLVSEDEWQKELGENLSKLYSYARELGGLISGEHGLGLSKRDFFFAETPAANVELMNAVKSAFDPKRILNANISYVR